MTVEAAIGFPVFLFAIMALLRLFIYDLRVYELERGLLRQAEVESVCLPSVEGLIGESIATDENGNFTVSDGIGLQIPSVMFGQDAMHVSRELRFRSFSGHQVSSLLQESSETETEAADTDEQAVFVTESGSVFHRSRDCPSLKLTVRSVSTDNIEKERNEDGGKYYPCEYCARGDRPKLLYITTDGARYHYDIGCRSLKRTVREIKESEAGDKRECKKCGLS